MEMRDCAEQDTTADGLAVDIRSQIYARVEHRNVYLRAARISRELAKQNTHKKRKMINISGFLRILQSHINKIDPKHLSRAI
jgi:hypothetical protein